VPTLPVGKRSHVHLLEAVRAGDPPVVQCMDCRGVTVVRAHETPRCGKCGAGLCPDCTKRWLEGSN
jgi:hypothetical protein